MLIQGVEHLISRSAIEYSVVIAYLYLHVLVDSKIEEKIIEVSTSSDCACPGDIVTYECTVIGDIGGITLWMGDFFHCPNGKREILLLHSDFTNGRGGEAYSTQVCNDGNVVGRIVRAENGSYTSQLYVTLTVTLDIVGKNIECAYDNGTVHRVGSLNLTKESTPSPPESITWVTYFSQFNITTAFNWNSHSHDCPAIHYNILASNCGSCPTTTNHTTVTCTDVPTDGSMCTFAVQTVVCGNIAGEVISFNNNFLGSCSSECRPALISAISLGVALVICLISLITTIILLIKSKTKVGTEVMNTIVHKEQTSNVLMPLSSQVNTRKNIAYVVYSPKTDTN